MSSSAPGGGPQGSPLRCRRRHGGRGIGGLAHGVPVLACVLTVLASVLVVPFAAAASAPVWTIAALPGASSGLTALTCVSAESCRALGPAPMLGAPAVLYSSLDGGVQWSEQRLPALRSGAADVVGLSCATLERCVAVGQYAARAKGSPGAAGIALVTSNAGKTWRAVALPARTGALSAVACTTAARCVAIGAANATGDQGPLALSSTNGGRTWRAEVLRLPAQDRLFGLGCASSTRCLATGTNGSGHAAVVLETANGGRTWSSRRAPSGVAALLSPDCPTARLCVAAGTAGASARPVVAFTSNGGASWRTARVPSGVGELDALSCTSALSCTAVGTDIAFNAGVVLVTSDGGRSWNALFVPTEAASLAAIACPSSCVAVGLSTSGSGAILTDAVAARGELVVTTAGLANGSPGHAYHAALSATGGRAPYRWSLKAGKLPKGLSLSRSGVISGTAKAKSRTLITVEVTDASGARATQQLELVVASPLRPPLPTKAPPAKKG